MTLWELLSNDERVIVLSNEGDGVIYTWNHSLTLQCWSVIGSTFREIDVRTLDRQPADWYKAVDKARKWQGDRWEAKKL